MKSRITVQFRKSLARLPDEIRQQARAAYRQFQDNPNHPSLRFKKVHPTLPIYSARINKSYRAVGQLHDGIVFGSGLVLILNTISCSTNCK